MNHFWAKPLDFSREMIYKLIVSLTQLLCLRLMFYHLDLPEVCCCEGEIVI